MGNKNFNNLIKKNELETYVGPQSEWVINTFLWDAKRMNA